MREIIIGFFCAGKTTYGQKRAKALNLPFFDTDHLIEKRFGRPVWEVFQELQEPAFRELEGEILDELKGDGILAVGGGTPLAHGERLKKMGPLFYLKYPFETLLQRIEKRRFPSYIKREDPQKQCLEVYQKRAPIYEALANFIVEDV